jgi:hypothetical protein
MALRYGDSMAVKTFRFKLFDYPLALFELVRQNINMPRSYPRNAAVSRRHLRYRGGQCRRLSVADDCRNAHRPVGGVLLDGRDPPPGSPFKPVPVVVAGRGGS